MTQDKYIRGKEISELSRKREISGNERLPVSAEEFVTPEQIAGISKYVLDLTSLTYPVVGKQIAEKLGRGMVADIYIKVGAELPLRQVVRIDPEQGGYRLYTGSVDAEEQGGCVVLSQLCYLLDTNDGTVRAEIKQLAEAVAPSKLEEYVRKDDRLVVVCGDPENIK